MQILDKDGKTVDQWTTDGTAHLLEAVLTSGATYTLHEVSAPDGYCVAADQTFTAPTDGTKLTLSMKDLYTKVTIAKYDITGTKDLAGAELELYATETDKDGNVVKKGEAIEAWTSNGASHRIVGTLTAGASYILHEVSAPDGYVLASDVTFTVNEDGTLTTVFMKDDTTKVEINKVTGDGAALSGAAMQILDAEGNVVDQWTSDGTAHLLEAVLTAGATYTLHETAAPDGYCIAADQSFTVPMDGTKLTLTIITVVK